MNLATRDSPSRYRRERTHRASSSSCILSETARPRLYCLRLARKICVPPRDPLAIGVPAERMAYGILGESGCPYCSYADCETDPVCSPPHRIGSGVPGGACRLRLRQVLDLAHMLCRVYQLEADALAMP